MKSSFAFLVDFSVAILSGGLVYSGCSESSSDSNSNELRQLFPESAWNTFTEQSRNEPGYRESEESRRALGLSDLPNGQWYYTYENMIKGMLLVPSFGGEGDENTRKLEIVSFLANVSQESGHMVLETLMVVQDV